MILHLYDHIGSSRHGDDISLPDSPIPRIGEWIYFHHEGGDWRKTIYRIVSVDYIIDNGKLVPELIAHEASEQHYQRAKTAIHDQHSDLMTDLRADPGI
jgi:hypothetical protein